MPYDIVNIGGTLALMNKGLKKFEAKMRDAGLFRYFLVMAIDEENAHAIALDWAESYGCRVISIKEV